MNSNNILAMRTILLACCLTSLTLAAQVDINTNTPEQTLDVNGKIKLTDDATAPSAGTLRYNATGDDFEGYDGTTWKSLTRASSGLPAGALPIYGYVDNINPGSTDVLDMYRWDTGIPERVSANRPQADST